MSNRAERRRQQRDAAANSYRLPAGVVYDEFVGELRPPNVRAFTELHVRYGVKNGLYVDWAITLQARLGHIEEFRGADGPLERRKLEVVDVSESGIHRHVFTPYEPDKPPTTTRLVELQAGDYARVDHEYMVQMNALAKGWGQKHGPAARNRHNDATWGFVEINRSPKVRNGDLSWVRNTLICIESDLADSVLSERGNFYFPRTKSAQGVLRSTGRMQFLTADPRGRLSPDEARARREDASGDSPPVATGDTTMGMLVDSIYAGDWTGQVDDFLSGDG